MSEQSTHFEDPSCSKVNIIKEHISVSKTPTKDSLHKKIDEILEDGLKHGHAEIRVNVKTGNNQERIAYLNYGRIDQFKIPKEEIPS